MTTTELTSLIIEDIIAEVPIQMDGDEQGIREEMSALIYSHVERYRKQMMEKFRSQLEVIDYAIKFSLQNGNTVDGIEIETCMIMLNENKE